MTLNGSPRPVLDSEALTVAMAVAPGVYARNRHYALYSDPHMRRARARAAVLRGLVRQLAGAEGPLEGLAIRRDSPHVEIRYRVARLRMERRAELTLTEAACLFHMATREGVPGLTPTADDRARLHGALRRLAATDEGQTIDAQSLSWSLT
jgi:hypothetical protein